MGNQGSQLGDEPSYNVNESEASKNLQHFDHSYKGTLHTCQGKMYQTFGSFTFQEKECKITTKGMCIELVEEQGLSSTKRMDVNYDSVTAVSWDHSASQVKIVSKVDDQESFVILGLANSVEFEQELKLRVGGIRGMRPPTVMYVGMFAGATKPKPFQRKRPNLTKLPAGKLPPLHDMRKQAEDLHRGAYKPCPPGESRRIELAFQHIMEGYNTFLLTTVKGNSSLANQWRLESQLFVTDEKLVFKPSGSYGPSVDFAYEDIADWFTEGLESQHGNDGGVEIRSPQGDAVFFGVAHVRDLKHTLEYFWNKYRISCGLSVMRGSTHGRPLVSMTTLSGEVAATAAPTGSTDVTDQDGMQVRPGSKMTQRRGSVMASVTSSKPELKTVPMENSTVKKHWHNVVLHQGWLLKKGGVGVGAMKSWLKRYVVLYQTSQGHFLAYYEDFVECPLFTAEKTQRNVIDLAKTTFVRPGSNRADQPDMPAHAFDIVTTEREWTLCAESQEAEMRWLKMLTRAIDEDVAILPDEDLFFKVKPKVDPTGNLNANEYSTVLKVSANGIAVHAPDAVTGNERQHAFWIYTDFYKWSLLSQQGKLALLVNVFADSSFNHRNEFVFRTTEALRLSTAIEFYIEKFMSVMHVRLEAKENVDTPAGLGDVGEGGLNQASADEFVADEAVVQQAAQELDLLNLMDDPTPQAAASASGASPDPFGADPFGAPTPPRAQTTTAPPAAADPFGADPFGAPAVSSPVPAAGGFGDDPFGFSAPSAAAAPAQPKIAPPLTAAQEGQHKTWALMAMTANSGPIYDDGCVQIASKIETRNSQCRLSLHYRNRSQSAASGFGISVTDPEGLVRCNCSAVASNELAPGAQGSVFVMMECLQPAFPGPSMTVVYNDPSKGAVTNVVTLPISVATFTEALPNLNGQAFGGQWTKLTAPGLEMQEVLKPSQPINRNNLLNIFNKTLHFSNVTGIPDASETVFYGACSLRTGALAANGDKVSIGCLAKIELNIQANALRVTVRTLVAPATTAMMQTVKSLVL